MPVDAKSLHAHAIKAEQELEALATGLGQAGADDNVVKTVTQCAGVARQVAAKLGERGAEQKDQAEQQPQPGQEPAQPPPGEPPPEQATEEQPPRHGGIAGATQALAQDVRKKRAARAQSPS